MEQAGTQNQRWASEIRDALNYARSEPLPLVASGIPELMDRASTSTRIGKWTGTGKPRYNEAGDKALVDLQFASGRDRYTYTGTLHLVGDRWRIRALREVAQALVTPVPESGQQ